MLHIVELLLRLSTLSSAVKTTADQLLLVSAYNVYDHVTSALQQLHWLLIHYQIQYKLCLLMYSVCQRQCPVCISNMVQSIANSTHRQGLRSSTCPTFVVPRTCTKLQERAFFVSGPVA